MLIAFGCFDAGYSKSKITRDTKNAVNTEAKRPMSSVTATWVRWLVAS